MQNKKISKILIALFAIFFYSALLPASKAQQLHANMNVAKICLKSKEYLPDIIKKYKINSSLLDEALSTYASNNQNSEITLVFSVSKGKCNVIEYKDLVKIDQYYKYVDTNQKTHFISKDDLQSLIKSQEYKVFSHPAPGSKISSYFGIRKHPITGQSRLHKGVDFANQAGTPILASCAGKIEYIGINGGYGKFIKIAHDNGYKTAYAHMSKFNASLKLGSYVKKGQIIGYMGSTGNSTGSHLHYEVLKANKHLDPLVVHKSIKSRKRNLVDFRKFKIKIAKVDSANVIADFCTKKQY